MKKLLSLFLSATILLSMIPEFVLASNGETSTWDGAELDIVWEGEGTSEKPYLISSAAEFAGLASSTYNALSTSTAKPVFAAVTDTAGIYNAYTGVYFKLTKDIDLASKEWTPIGRFAMRFNGNFDGNGHIIKNLKISKAYYGVGLFGATGADAKITKLGIETASFSFKVADNTVADKPVTGGDASYGAVYPYNGYTETRVFGAGTLVGIYGGGTIEDCYVRDSQMTLSGSVTGGGLGGLIGAGRGVVNHKTGKPTVTTTIKRSYVNGFTVTGTGKMTGSGAIAGSARENATIFHYGCNLNLEDCYATDIDITINNRARIFAEANFTSSTFTRCYATDTANSAGAAYTTTGNQSGDTTTIIVDKAGLITAMTALDGWSADNETEPVNNGYPVLDWQVTWSETPETPTETPTETPKPSPDVWDGTVATGFASGTGEENDPYIISSAAELAYLANSTYNALSTSTDAPISATVTDTAGIYNAYTGVYFKLTKDIDLASKEWTPIGRHGMRFNGNFDGNGHVVKNLKMTTAHMGMGFFGATGKNIKVTNLGLENVSFNYTVKPNAAKDKVVEGGDASYSVPEETNGDSRPLGTGALVGIFSGGTFEDCYVKTVSLTTNTTGYSQNYAGGMFGAPYCTTSHESAYYKRPTEAVTANRCYVNGFTANCRIQFLGAFAGSARKAATNYYNGCIFKFTDCYTANADMTNTTGKTFAFADTLYTFNSKFERCYSTDAANSSGTAYKNAEHSDENSSGTELAVTTIVDKAGLITAMTALDGWSADNATEPVNDGYPVLLWQNTWMQVVTPTPAPTTAPTSSATTAPTTVPTAVPTAVPTPTPKPAIVPDVAWEGNGSAESPYLITSKEELFGLAQKAFNATSVSTDVPVVATDSTGIYNTYSGVNFKLTTDIDLGNEEWVPIGRHGMRFNGNFDGDGHVIKNLKITKSYLGMGLFGATGKNVKITKLGIENATFNYTVYTSAVVDSPLIDSDASYPYVEEGDVRVYGTGSLVGIFAGGTFEDCFARNVKIARDNGGYSQTEAGGLLGGAFCTTSHESAANKQPVTQLIANRCYVNGVTVSGGRVLFAGGFAGSARKASTNYYNGCVMKFTDCYASNVEILSGGTRSAFADARYATASSFTRCYATNLKNSSGSEYRNDEAMIKTRGQIVTELVDGDHGFALDGNHMSKNSSMPILLWEAGWLAGEDTDIVSKKLLNTITNGQSPDYIFNNVNFPETLEVDGVQYKMDYISALPEYIANDGKVSHQGEARDVDIYVYMYDAEADKYYKETITLTVTPRGLCVFTESFDNSLTAWTTGEAFTQSASVSGNINDKMLNIATFGGDGVMSREFVNSSTDAVFNDSVLKAVFSIYNDADFGNVSVDLGGAVVSVSKTGVTVNGETTGLTLPDGTENTWVPVMITADINSDSIGVTIGTNTIETGYDFTTVGKISFNEGQAKVDNLLVYEYIPEALDALTESLVLNGNTSKFDVKTPLNMPTEIPYHRGTINVKWETSDDKVVATDGTLGVVEMSKKVTLTAYAYDGSLLGDGEVPDEDDYIASKTFEVHVVPVGSVLVYADDFNSVERESSAVSDYPGWSDSTNPYTKFTFERDPLSDLTASFASVNKAMKIERFINGHTDAPIERATCKLTEPLNADLIEISYDMYTTSLNNQPMFTIAGMAEIYIRNTGGFFNWTSEIGGKGIHSTWYFKPGTWQNHKYIVDTVNKTVTFYLEGRYNFQVRYNTGTDTIGSIAFGSQRLTDKVGNYYFDNPTIRVIMPEDNVAVSTVKDSLVVPETVTGNIDLPTDGAYETDIWWESSDTDVIDINGSVTRQSTDKAVTLKAYVAKGNTIAEKTFTVTVSAFAEDANAADIISGIAKRFTFSEISDESQFAVTNDIDLIRTYNKGDAKRLGGVNVTWDSSDDSVIDINGNVTQSFEDKCVVLTATFEKNGAEATKEFKVYVQQSSVVNNISERFEGYGIGSDIEKVSTDWSYSAAADNTGNARVTYKGTDSDNSVLYVKRKTSVNGTDMVFDYDVNMSSSDIMFSTMFKLEKLYDVIKIDIGGVEQSVVIKPTSIKVDSVEYPVTLNCGEWYQFAVYYDDTTDTYIAFLDTQKLASSPLPYNGDGGVTGVTIKNIKNDRGGGKWALDEISVRNVAISNDRSAIETALKEIELGLTEIEWNIENLPDAGKYGVSLEWISSDEEYLENDGTVHRDSQDHTLTFTARASRNGVTVDKPFTVTVKAIPDGLKPTQEIFDKHMSEIPFSFYTDEDTREITKDIALPTEYKEGNSAFYGGADISWSSDNKKVMDDTGKVVRPYLDEAVTLTATYTAKRDPNIKKTISYKLTVWAEGEELFREDFEDTPAELEGVRVGLDPEGRFWQEVPPTAERYQASLFSKDALDFDKSWEEANKVISIERLLGYGLAECERNNFRIPQITDIDSVAVSFDLMLDSTGFAVNIGPNLYQLSMISNTSFAYNTNKAGQLSEKKWYRFTFIIMRSAGLICVLCDGKKVNDYIYQSTGTVLSSIYFDIERHQPIGKCYFDNVVVRDLSSVDETAVKEALNAILINEGDVYENLILENTGINRTLITYSSSAPEVISNDGTVTRPVDSDREVEFTATVRRGGVIENKVFKLNVKKADAYTTPFAINRINGTNKVFSSVNITNQTGYVGEDMYLMVLAYDKSDIVATRCVPIASFTGTSDITFNEIDLSDVEYYRLEAYIIDGPKTVSNKQLITY